MKNSTILFVFGILGLGGVGAYLYLKNKKAPSSSTPTSGSNSTSTSGSNSTSTTGSTSTSTTGSTSVADSSLGLLPTEKGLIDETKTNDYIIAKKISEEVMDLQKKIKELPTDFVKRYPHLNKPYSDLPNTQWKLKDNLINSLIIIPRKNMTKDMVTKTAEANALGYKILPYGLIEKM
jgi:hypothetical protein